MRKIILLFVLLYAHGAFGQTSCTSASGACVPLGITYTVPAGQTATATLLKCGGTCTAASLAAYMANPSATSPWILVATFPQKAAQTNYNDFETYGAQISYAAYNTLAGGSAGPVSGISTFQMPQAPQSAPSLTAGPNVVTSGVSGPQ